MSIVGEETGNPGRAQIIYKRVEIPNINEWLEAKETEAL